jgi:hypothetical protein
LAVNAASLIPQAVAPDLLLQSQGKNPISALTDVISMHVCSGLQNSSKTINTEKSYLLLLVHGAWCKVAGVQFGDSSKTN